jgi:hypothetical protein
MPQNPSLHRTPDYHSARAAEERRLAETAADPNARAVHERLAEQYERLAKGAANEQVTEIRHRAD